MSVERKRGGGGEEDNKNHPGWRLETNFSPVRISVRVSELLQPYRVCRQKAGSGGGRAARCRQRAQAPHSAPWNVRLRAGASRGFGLTGTNCKF